MFTTSKNQTIIERVYTQKLLRKAKYLDLLREVLRRAEKDHKPCPDFCISCSNCQHTMFISGLYETLSYEKWREADKKKK